MADEIMAVMAIIRDSIYKALGLLMKGIVWATAIGVIFNIAWRLMGFSTADPFPLP
jgi:hypothetical protein